MERKNCWEVSQCGRQPGGENVERLGVCPAAVPSAYDGTNKGTCAGRFCWAVAGTMCEGRVQGTYADKLVNCLACDFFKRVNDEEGRNFILAPRDIKRK